MNNINKKFFEISFCSKDDVVEVYLSQFSDLKSALRFARNILSFFDYDHVRIRPISLD